MVAFINWNYRRLQWLIETDTDLNYDPLKVQNSETNIHFKLPVKETATY